MNRVVLCVPQRAWKWDTLRLGQSELVDLESVAELLIKRLLGLSQEIESLVLVLVLRVDVCGEVRCVANIPEPVVLEEAVGRASVVLRDVEMMVVSTGSLWLVAMCPQN